MADHVIPVPEEWAQNGWVDEAGYFKLYQRSLDDPEGFWADQAKRLHWIKPPTQIKDVDYTGDVRIRWYADGVLNASANCLDRHLSAHADQTAIIWEGDSPSDSRHISYAELHQDVCRLANALKAKGVNKGDRVTIYMPMIPEAAVAMLACARIGAIHSVVFGGFSPDSLRDRILDCKSDVVITADEGVRGGRKVPLKANTDEALKSCPNVKTVVVVRRTGGQIGWADGRDYWYHDICAVASNDCPPEPMGAEDPLFILYTSGSTGKPKGVLHTTGGYMVYTSLTHQYVFDYHDGDIYWCTADVGWVTGHSYIVYGPLANGATTLMFEGVPNYPELVALVAGVRQAQGQHLLHRPDRHPRPDARGRRPGEARVAQDRAPSRHGGRADQSGGVALVLQRGGRGALPHRRHVVADRDRRDPDLAAAGRDAVEARVGHPSAVRREAGGDGRRGPAPRGRLYRQSVPCR